jgi:two-component system CheB/CheR fusion protein
VVGIGASAGGLEAFTQLISNLPNDTGMAFVLLQHLEPSQPSMLSEIIARSTTMPVQEVEDGMAVAPNQVYVIPPNQGLTLEAGKFQLLSRDRTQGSRRVIDVFFKSLAEDRGVKSIGVVLSGAMLTAPWGIEAIKAAGGITLAQSENTAQVSSMPHMAIATGQIDFVQPPADLARTLVRSVATPIWPAPRLQKRQLLLPVVAMPWRIFWPC